MEYRRLGRSGLKVSPISLGSWLTIGNAVQQEASDRLVAHAVERGINLLDTADVYNNGEGELALGRAIAGLRREHLVIASKCFFPMSDDVNDRGLSRKHIVESIHQSLRRIGTDYLDLYQCHRPDPGTPVEETAMAMDDLIRQGKVLYWGVSEWPGHLIREAVAFCRNHALHAPISNQPLYNLFARGIEQDVVPASEACGVGQIVFSPLAQGVLTGKYGVDGKAPTGSRAADDRANRFIGRYMSAEHLGKAEKLVDLAKRLGHSAAEVALAYCLHNQNVASVIIGATSTAQLDENLRATEVLLSRETIEELTELFPV